MSNNNWQSQNNQGGPTEPENPPRKSGLLSNYARQQPGSAPQPPANNPMLGGPPPSSPLPPPSGQFNRPGPAPQGPPSYAPMGPPSQQLMPPGMGPSSQQLQPPQQQQWNGPAFIARPVQMVQRWSNKMNAIHRPGPNVDPNPLVRYRGPQPPVPPSIKPVPTRPTTWRRSRTQRITHLRKRRMERNRLSGPSSKRLRTTIFAVIVALLLTVITSTAGYAYNFYQSELPQVQGLSNMQIPQSTRIYDRHGTLLYTLYANGVWGDGGRSTPISYNELPGFLQDAQIATEDPTFWSNPGIDVQGMARALQQFISAGGEAQSGGSTMTQQLIKNLSGDAQDTAQRKISEAALAIGLTQQYPKWKIMEMYFNDTPYGTQDKGIEAAVEDYFGLVPQCNTQHQCIPGVAFLNSDLTKCKVTRPQIDETTCAQDPTGLLGLSRAVLLAGIPQNPTHFDPTVSNENFNNVVQDRVPYVLNQMIADGMQINVGLGSSQNDVGPVTQAIATQVEKMVDNMTIVGFKQTMLAPHFVQWVISTLATSMGNGNYNQGLDVLESSGLNIYTTLDLNLEEFIVKDISHNLHDRVKQEFLGTYGPLTTEYNVNDSAVVVMDAKNGEILAMDGSSDWNNTTNKKVAGQVNAALSLRQPGSSIKPIVYAAAFEKGWYPGIKMIDEKTYFPNGSSTSQPAQGSTYAPTDYGQTYHPQYSDTDIRISLANSFNIPAIKGLMYAGIDSVVDMARRLGITDIDTDMAIYNAAHPNGTNDLDQLFGPSLALGTPGISLLQMVGAYQAFANNGARVPYHNILDIWDNYGHDLVHYDPNHPNSTQVLSPQIAFLIGSMLSDNPARLEYEFGGTDTLVMTDWGPDHQVAAKTGTTDSNLDNWTLGFTSSVVVGVWSGNADGNDPMDGIIGITGAGPIWHDVIEYVSGRSLLGMVPDLHYPTNTFSQPDGLVKASTSHANGLMGSDVSDWMLANEQPTTTGLPTCNTSSTTPSQGNGQSPTPTMTEGSGNNATVCMASASTTPNPNPNPTPTPGNGNSQDDPGGF